MFKKKRRLTEGNKLEGFILLIISFSFLFCFEFRFLKLLTEYKYIPRERLYNSVEKKVSLIMVGDVLIHSAVYADALENGTYNFEKMLTEIKPIVSSYDLAFYNQETILGGAELGLSTYPTFNSPYEVGDAFLDAGFNLVSLANNHTLDRGEKAIINSRNYWNSKNALVSGSAMNEEERDTIEIFEKNGITFSMIAYTTSTNGINRKKDYLVNIYDKEIVKKDIERVRNTVDVLMISMHWGDEYYQGITEEQKEIAEYLSSLGVDIIIGHHPHVIEPIDYIGDTLVIYSLGNFISAQVGVEKLTGLMVALEIKKEIIHDKVEVEFSSPSVDLVYTSSLRTNTRTNFKLYPYQKLNDELLPNYQKYYQEYLNIVTSKVNNIKVGIE